MAASDDDPLKALENLRGRHDDDRMVEVVHMHRSVT
jgi:hypothetical protein